MNEAAPTGLPEPHDAARRFEGLRGEVRLRAAIDDLANQLCSTVDGDFDLLVRSAIEDETLEKLAMLINFVLDTARRGMSALREHNDKLAELDQAKTVFFSNASHELRTPLTLMLGPMEDALAQRAALAGEPLAMAHRNAVRLHKLVNALLDFSRIEAGRLQAHYRPTDLAAATAELAGVFRAAIERAGLALTVDCPPLPERVWVDPEMWEKVVLNLLSNAFKFTFEGGIGVALRAHEDRVELTVTDSGIGIAAQELPRIFERFHRVEGARSRSHEGFGIGLAMIHELVRLHGGGMAVTSAPGTGTTFTVTLRRGKEHLPADRVAAAPDPSVGSVAGAYLAEVADWQAVDAQRAAVQMAAPARPLSGPVAPARILVADDNGDMRAYLGRLLGQYWSVESVGDGQAALEAALQRRPDLVLTDVMMPRLDGYGLLRALRAEERTRDVPIVLLSARAGSEAVAEGLEVGADDYLVKPFSARELIARVRTHLELARLRADTAIIQRVGLLLNTQWDLEKIVQTLTDEATRLCGAQFGAFFYNMVSESGESYMLYTLAGVPREAFKGFPLPRNTELFKPTFEGTGIVRLDDVTQDPRYGHSAPYHGMPKGHLPVRSYLAVPVVSRSGEVLGGLFFGHAEPAMFTARNESVLAAVAAQAAIAIDNARLYERAQAARADAETANRAKDEFLAMLGHELRNPLAPIVTALELLKLRGEKGTAMEREVISRQVNHVVRLVDDLLDVSRITRGKIELNRLPVDLAKVVSKAVEMASPILEDRHHQLTLRVPTGLVVEGDPVRLAQVVSNLLTNAAKYTDPPGAITVTAARQGDQIVLSVQDNGVGIPPEILPRIFDLFEQEPQSLARSQGGLGLGLAIVRSLVAMHGGSVSAHSTGRGHGSEFTVRLPAFDGAALPPPHAVEPLSVRPLAKGGRRVLVVDDNRDAAQMMAITLEMLGHETRVAHDGAAALRLAEEWKPEFVLLDLGLPVMSGYEVAERIRLLPTMTNARIIAVTGYGQEADRQRTADGGFDHHLVKPVDIAALAELLEASF